MQLRNTVGRTLGKNLILGISALALSLMVAGTASAAGKATVVIKTTAGDIKLELDAEKAPISVKNFLDYAREGFYDGTIFHRVVPNFVIQGGGFTADMSQKKTKPPIKNEAHNGLPNDKGTISMARTGVVDSATSQFYINLRDNTPLNHTAKTTQGYGYAVFGKVVEGLDVVEKIGKVATGRKGGHAGVPLEDVVIDKVDILSE